MANFSPELLNKAKTTQSPEELLALARENGVNLTAEEAKAYYGQLNPTTGELSDNELDSVSGGGCGDKQPTFSNGDRAKLRDCITGYQSKCGSRSGTFRRDSSCWWLECDTYQCGCTVIRQISSVVEAAFLEKL